MSALDIFFLVIGFSVAGAMIFLHFVAVTRGWYDVAVDWFDARFGKPAPACGCGCGK